MTAATVAAPTYSHRFGNKIPNAGLTCQTFSHTWLTAETDEENDTVEFGYVPAGVVVIGFSRWCCRKRAPWRWRRRGIAGRRRRSGYSGLRP